jgi:hypothetical protein
MFNQCPTVEREFNVVIEQDEDDYFVASVPVLRGCHRQAKSLDVLMRRINEAEETVHGYSTSAGCQAGPDESAVLSRHTVKGRCMKRFSAFIISLLVTVVQGMADPLYEYAKPLLQVPALAAKLDADIDTQLAPLREQCAKAEGQQRKTLDTTITRLFWEAKERQKKELETLVASLSPSYEGYLKELTGRIFRTPKGDYAEARISGQGENRSGLMYFQNYDKTGMPTVAVALILIGARVLPANHIDYRDGIKTWTSTGDDMSTVVAEVGAFQAHLTVHGKKIERKQLNALLDSFLDLDTLCQLPLIDPKTIASLANPPRLPPGPMGQVVLKMLKAANTGDYVTVRSCCSETYSRGSMKNPKLEQQFWDGRTLQRSLDFSEGKTCVWSEGKTMDGVLRVQMLVISTNETRRSYYYYMES